MNAHSFHCGLMVALAGLLCLPALPRTFAEEPDAPKVHEEFDWKKFPHTKDFEIPAAATQADPMRIAKVTAGQKVSLVILYARWGGGGTKGNAYTDYRDRREHNGLPWMALVAKVGNRHFLPDRAEYSFTAPEDGELVLFANDDNPDGNKGRVKVTVKIE